MGRHRKIKPQLNCVVCGNAFTPRLSISKYCSNACRAKGVARAKLKRKICTCKRCGKEFWPKNANNMQYCGRKCGLQRINLQTVSNGRQISYFERLKEYRICRVCGDVFISSANGCLCSKPCRIEDAKRLSKTIYYANVEYISGICTCVRCGKQFEKKKAANKCLYCSPRCQQSAAAQRRRVRLLQKYDKPLTISQHIAISYARKHKLRRYIKETEAYCGICGMQIDRSLTYPHPYALSVDHIVPLARGGTDDNENLQPAHLICNSRKGVSVAV